MNIAKITADPDLYRAVTPDDPDIIQKPLQRAKTARRGDELSRRTPSPMTPSQRLSGRFRAPQGQTGPVGSEG